MTFHRAQFEALKALKALEKKGVIRRGSLLMNTKDSYKEGIDAAKNRQGKLYGLRILL